MEVASTMKVQIKRKEDTLPILFGTIGIVLGLAFVLGAPVPPGHSFLIVLSMFVFVLLVFGLVGFFIGCGLELILKLIEQTVTLTVVEERMSHSLKKRKRKSK